MYDKFRLALAAAVAVLLLSSCTTTYLIRGEGGTSCATVVERLRTQPEYRSLYEAWLLGYLTHFMPDRLQERLALVLLKKEPGTVVQEGALLFGPEEGVVGQRRERQQSEERRT